MAAKDPVTDFEFALHTLCTLNDVPARQDFIKALQAYVDHRIAVHIANVQPPFMVSQNISDADYEALLARRPQLQITPVTYVGPQPLRCQFCNQLLVPYAGCPTCDVPSTEG